MGMSRKQPIKIPTELLILYAEEEIKRAIQRLPHRGTDRWRSHSIWESRAKSLDGK